jgi:hypothetical protein
VKDAGLSWEISGLKGGGNGVEMGGSRVPRRQRGCKRFQQKLLTRRAFSVGENESLYTSISLYS